MEYMAWILHIPRKQHTQAREVICNIRSTCEVALGGDGDDFGMADSVILTIKAVSLEREKRKKRHLDFHHELCSAHMRMRCGRYRRTLRRCLPW